MLQAVQRAPIRYDEQVTDEERAAVAAAADGPWIPHEEVMAELEARRPSSKEHGAHWVVPANYDVDDEPVRATSSSTRPACYGPEYEPWKQLADDDEPSAAFCGHGSELSLSTPDGIAAFWVHAEKNAAEVATWPAWKRHRVGDVDHFEPRDNESSAFDAMDVASNDVSARTIAAIEASADDLAYADDDEPSEGDVADAVARAK